MGTKHDDDVKCGKNHMGGMNTDVACQNMKDDVGDSMCFKNQTNPIGDKT